MREPTKAERALLRVGLLLPAWARGGAVQELEAAGAAPVEMPERCLTGFGVEQLAIVGATLAVHHDNTHLIASARGMGS
jgi:hypothetical protein